LSSANLAAHGRLAYDQVCSRLGRNHVFTLQKAAAPVATINGVAMAMQPRETVLQAALRHGMAFPHSCRVGGCATCKCRLLTGKVKELTSAAYVLTEQELAAATS
jgi:3-phenylpropionate/trans-cinnamate dioxygenase ferredoxin reductase subunit